MYNQNNKKIPELSVHVLKGGGPTRHNLHKGYTTFMDLFCNIPLFVHNKLKHSPPLH